MRGGSRIFKKRKMNEKTKYFNNKFKMAPLQTKTKTHLGMYFSDHNLNTFP